MKKVLLLHKGYLTLEQALILYGSVLKELELEYSIDILLKGLLYYPNNKIPAIAKKEWLKANKNYFETFDYILVSDAEYFKTITKKLKVDAFVGVILNSEFFNTKILYIPPVSNANYDLLKFKNKTKIVFKSISDDIKGNYIEIGSNIIHSEYYPNTVEEIKSSLDKLLEYPMLALDIETKSLKVTEAGIYTIGFAWDKHNGIAFSVDSHSEPRKIRNLLRNFFDTYKGKLIVHKGNYDIPVLVYNLYMEEDFTNLKQQVLGIKTLCKNLEDTLLISYLATNSCSGNILSLKQLAQPFAGNWAVDVSDVTKVDMPSLLRYNLIDVLSTLYVREIYYPKMVNDDQENIFLNHFMPYLQDCIRMQLNGLPIHLNRVYDLEKNLIEEKYTLLSQISKLPSITQAEYLYAKEKADKLNSKYKKKQVSIEECKEPFNFNSNKQMEILLYKVMELPIIETTDSGNPSVAGSTLKALISHTDNDDYILILNNIALLNDVEKILSGFLPAFKSATTDKKGNVRLSGYLNLGGTVSGRMSSNQPNLQNLPATGSRFAKPVKRIFGGNSEWIMCGIDFNALEDRIDALKTRDTQKLKVYTNGYDGHCLRAYTYFKEYMPDIVDTVESINSIATKYKKFRQLSKAPSFALLYGGSYVTLMRNCGFTEEEAKKIEQGYHTLYKESDNWIKEKINQAKITGYVTGAFGLRVRTPMLLNAGKYLTSLQSAEARTAGNALGQGWGLLNNRAMHEVLEKIDEMGYEEDIYPICAIHDACYYMVRNNIKLILWLNKTATEAAKWQDDPVIYNPDVGLSGQLDLFIPDWSNPITLPEEISSTELYDLVNERKK